MTNLFYSTLIYRMLNTHTCITVFCVYYVTFPSSLLCTSNRKAMFSGTLLIKLSYLLPIKSPTERLMSQKNILYGRINNFAVSTSSKSLIVSLVRWIATRVCSLSDLHCFQDDNTLGLFFRFACENLGSVLLYEGNRMINQILCPLSFN